MPSRRRYVRVPSTGGFQRYQNLGNTPGKFLYITSSGGFEQVVQETSLLMSSGHPDLQKVKDVARNHGIDFI
jgi:hypothetical protein